MKVLQFLLILLLCALGSCVNVAWAGPSITDPFTPKQFLAAGGTCEMNAQGRRCTAGDDTTSIQATWTRDGDLRETVVVDQIAMAPELIEVRFGKTRMKQQVGDSYVLVYHLVQGKLSVLLRPGSTVYRLTLRP